jgi:toxin FitB
LILLDTNVLSEMMKPEPDRPVDRWYHAHFATTRLPVIAIAEVAFGIARLARGARKRDLDAQLAQWRLRFADRIFPFGEEAALLYGEVLAESERAGKPMSFADAQIAAIAREHGAALATRNVKDFSTTGLRLVDPWAG